MTLSDTPLPAGEQLSERYEIVSFLGKGKAGQVYRVRDLHLDKEVALKLFEPRPGEPAVWDEAQILERLSSEYLIPVYNADVLPVLDLRYITMPVMSGGDLEKQAARTGVTPLQAIRWGRQLAVGLDRVHAAGLLHRDVKPENAYLTESNDVRLGDLGLAAQADASGEAPQGGTIVTVAPEVLRVDGKCTKRSDIYSLAATVYYLLAGDYAVNRRGSAEDVARRVAAGEKRHLRDLAPHVSLGLSLVIERGMSLDPDARPATALDFANALAEAKCHRRPWELIAPHEGHVLCLSSGRYRVSKGIVVCAVPSGQPNRWSIEVRNENGRRARRREMQGLTYDKLLVELRKLTAAA